MELNIPTEQNVVGDGNCWCVVNFGVGNWNRGVSSINTFTNREAFLTINVSLVDILG